MSSTIAAGLSGTSSRIVGSADLATSMGSGTVEVFATPAMIALMEEAAVDALAPALPDGLTSVGIYLEVHHLAGTPLQMSVSATATVIEVDGRVITFEVSATDGLEIIGRGVHRRVIVDGARFVERVSAKTAHP
ncbi:MAG: thioesterase family protein [Caldilineaceae bacterium]